ncbi:MAG: thioredoxin [Microthrixaceae bacterium]
MPAATGGLVRCASCHAELPWVVDAGEATFDEVVSTSRLPVVVDLWAPWCGPCRTVSPLLEQMAVEYAGRMKLVKVNVDEAPSVQARFGVQGIPTFVLLSGGEEVSRLVGAQPLASLRSWFDSAVAGG